MQFDQHLDYIKMLFEGDHMNIRFQVSSDRRIRLAWCLSTLRSLSTPWPMLSLVNNWHCPVHQRTGERLLSQVGDFIVEEDLRGAIRRIILRRDLSDSMDDFGITFSSRINRSLWEELLAHGVCGATTYITSKKAIYGFVKRGNVFVIVDNHDEPSILELGSIENGISLLRSRTLLKRLGIPETFALDLLCDLAPSSENKGNEKVRLQAIIT